MDFLATKKNAFPRFFFLSVDDLLDILSNGDKPQKINKAGHVAKIFQAAECFIMKEYDDQNQMPDVTGIIACIGKETFNFHDPLPLKGKVEIYMQFIIDHIIEQQRFVVEEMMAKRMAVAEGDKEALKKWYEADIASPTVVVNQVSWVMKVEKAFDAIAGGKTDAMNVFY
jgi:dynein heavy chain